MEKQKISVHAFTAHLYTIAIVVLVLLLIALGLKYLHLKLSLNHFTKSEIYQQLTQKPSGSIQDYAQIISTSIQYPLENPIYKQPAVLESYVLGLSSEMKRDVVVMDLSQKIIADTIEANVGIKYSSDSMGEIGKTLSDGEARTFTEKSSDYPSGLLEVAVPMKDAKGSIIGAVIVSYDQVRK